MLRLGNLTTVIPSSSFSVTLLSRNELDAGWPVKTVIRTPFLERLLARFLEKVPTPPKINGGYSLAKITTFNIESSAIYYPSKKRS